MKRVADRRRQNESGTGKIENERGVRDEGRRWHERSRDGLK